MPLIQPLRLSALRCQVCGTDAITLIGVPIAEAAPLLCWCGVVCARAEGWPFLGHETQRVPRGRPA